MEINFVLNVFWPCKFNIIFLDINFDFLLGGGKSGFTSMPKSNLQEKSF